MRRALVLGGGGVVGIAWESGLLAGLAEGGVDVREADLVVGTSAGSFVGTRIAAGVDPQSLTRSEQRAVRAPQPEGGLDIPTLTKVFELWSQAAEMTPTELARIGALALQARTVSEDLWIERTGGSVGVEDWPETALRIASVDVESGELAVHDRASGAPLARAIAASCAIPGMFPPVAIAGRRYMDGGVRSGTNADVALDLEPERVLVAAPMCEGTVVFGSLAERCMRDEAARLQAAGAHVHIVTPNDAEIEAFGPNLMDPARVEPAAAAGRERGRILAAGEAAVWND